MGKDSSARNRPIGAQTRTAFGGLSKPSVRTTYQLAAKLGRASIEPREVWSLAYTATLKWLMTKFSARLPEHALQGKSFEIDEVSRKLEAVGVDSIGLWSARLTHPDEPIDGRAPVAGRSWVTEVALAKDGNHVHFGARVMVASPANCAETVAFTRPRVVIEVARAAGLSDGRPMDGNAWLVGTENECAALYDLLVNPTRALPVIIVSGLAPRQFDRPMGPYVLDADKLARELQGFAHVAKIPYEAAYIWTRLVGKPWSTYRGAVRVMWPKLSFDKDSPFVHDLEFAEKIFWWREDDLAGEAAFAKHLKARICEVNSSAVIDWRGTSFLLDARVRQAQAARSAAREGKDWGQLVEEENRALLAQIAQKEEQQREFAGLLEIADKELNEARGDIKLLKGQIHALREQLAAKTGQSVTAQIPPCSSLEEIPEWAGKYMADRLALHSRALNGLKKGVYQDVELVCKCLLLLSNEYYDLRMGTTDKAHFEEAAANLHVSFSGSIAKERAGQEGDTYFVQWPLGSGTKRFLEYHLRKGTDRDERYCLGIYFFWDDQSERVVIGWLPSHLDNQLT